MPYNCKDCSRSFNAITALSSHCRAKAHAFHGCFDCDRVFVSSVSLAQVRNGPWLPYAHTAHYSLKHLEASPAHAASDSSGEDSDDSSVVSDDEHPYCRGCDRWFIDLDSLYQHLSASLKHNWCFICSRDFSSETALEQVRPTPPSHCMNNA